jgi:3-methyladenine DNA glycosylase AlkD
MMTAKEYVALIHEALDGIANPLRALEMKAYMRNQFEFLGIQTPARRSIFKTLPKLPKDAKLILQIAHELWEKPEREFRYVACDLLAKNVKLFKLDDLTLIKKLLQKDAWWDTVDSLSGAIGNIVLNEKLKGQNSQTLMDQWLLDSDFWVRRSAMIHQLGWRDKTDIKRLQHYALQLSGESEFFIRKAIAWALRDYAWQNPEFVRTFVNQNVSVFSNLTIREATKNL